MRISQNKDSGTWIDLYRSPTQYRDKERKVFSLNTKSQSNWLQHLQKTEDCQILELGSTIHKEREVTDKSL